MRIINTRLQFDSTIEIDIYQPGMGSSMAKNFSAGFVFDAPHPGAAGDLSTASVTTSASVEKADLK